MICVAWRRVATESRGLPRVSGALNHLPICGRCSAPHTCMNGTGGGAAEQGVAYFKMYIYGIVPVSTRNRDHNLQPSAHVACPMSDPD